MRKNDFKKSILFGLVFLILFFTFYSDVYFPQKDQSQNSQNPSQEAVFYDTVVYVYDGDTVLLKKGKKVRLLGIDTPEIGKDGKKDECFAKEAKQKAIELLAKKRVKIETDKMQPRYDKYGRLLAYIFLEDGTNINKFLIQEGYAKEFTYKQKPYKYQKEFKEAENTAKENKKGIWGSC